MPETQQARCPVAHVDPYTDEYAAHNGERWFGPARAEMPVFFDEGATGWFVTRYEDVLDVLRQPEVFSSANAVELRPLWPELEAAYPEGHPVHHALVRSDPPAHTRRRKLVNQALTPRAVAALEPQIRERCLQLIAAMAPRGAGEFVADFAQALPVHVITDMIGAPRGLEHDFVAWAGDTFALMTSGPPIDDAMRDAIDDRARRMAAWLDDFIAERRRAPTDDICSRLIAAQDEDGGAQFSNAEIVSMINGLLTAGTHTSTMFMTRLVRELLLDDALRADALASREALERTVEEGLRVLTPVRVARRLAVRPAVVGGVEIPAGDAVVLALVSANHDEAQFPAPDAFDPSRPALKSHLSFGKLTHMCIGAPLARLEAVVAMETLFAELPHLRLDGDAVSWQHHLVAPRLTGLPLRWDADA